MRQYGISFREPFAYQLSPQSRPRTLLRLQAMKLFMVPNKILKRSFYERDTRIVAFELIGKILTFENEGREFRGEIVETEAYLGAKDPASHAFRGPTPRNQVMFGPAGFWYVYLIYGVHWMLNIVTGPKKYPAAVLIRGVQGVSGPGRLTKHFKIQREFNGKKATAANKLWIEDRGTEVLRSEIRTTPRVGVDYAGPLWSQKPYRFLWTPSKRNDKVTPNQTSKDS